jgi:hypothetical protein
VPAGRVERQPARNWVRKRVTSDGAAPATDDPLLAYSQGRPARNEAIRLFGLRDYAELLVAFGDVDLPLPPPHEVENQAVTFAKLWKPS